MKISRWMVIKRLQIVGTWNVNRWEFQLSITTYLSSSKSIKTFPITINIIITITLRKIARTPPEQNQIHRHVNCEYQKLSENKILRLLAHGIIKTYMKMVSNLPLVRCAMKRHEFAKVETFQQHWRWLSKFWCWLYHHTLKASSGRKVPPPWRRP